MSHQKRELSVLSVDPVHVIPIYACSIYRYGNLLYTWHLSFVHVTFDMCQNFILWLLIISQSTFHLLWKGGGGQTMNTFLCSSLYGTTINVFLWLSHNCKNYECFYSASTSLIFSSPIIIASLSPIKETNIRRFMFCEDVCMFQAE